MNTTKISGSGIPVLSILGLIPAMLSFNSADPDFRVKDLLKDLGLKGKVKSIVEIKFDAMNGGSKIQQGAMEWKHLYLFNIDGNITEEQLLGSDEGQISRTIYMYDLDGRMVQSSEYTGDSLETVHTYLYDGFGNESGGYCYSHDNQRESWISKTVGKGDKTILINASQDGTYRPKYECQFDTKGNLVELDSVDISGKMTSKTTFKYDNKEHILEKKMMILPGGEETLDTYTYDKAGRLTEETSDSGGSQKKLTYTYEGQDEMGNWLIKTQTMGTMYMIVRNVQYFDE